MDHSQVYTILGALLSIFLGVNAYFVRELVRSIQDVQIGVASHGEKIKSAHIRIDEHSENIELLRERGHQFNNSVQEVSLKVALLEKDVQNFKRPKA